LFFKFGYLTDLAQAARDPDEEGDYMAFEQLMADAAIKKDKKDPKKDKKEAKKEEKEAKTEDSSTTSHHHHHGIPSHHKADPATKSTS